MFRPLTTQLVDVEIQVVATPAADAEAVYPVIGEPPVELGACHDTAICLSCAVALTRIGGSGTVKGVAVVLSELMTLLAASVTVTTTL